MGAKMFDIRRLDGVGAEREAAELVSGFDENDGIESQNFFWFGSIMTVLFICAMASASVMPVIKDLGMGYVALSFAAIMLTRYKATADRFYQAVDWDLLAFFGCLFIVINMMEHALVLELIGDGLKPILGLGEQAGIATLMAASAVASSVTDNIPLAAMLAKILGGMDIASESPIWWAVIFGANLGGNITPIGSASTLVAVTIIHKNNLPMSFARFVKVAVPFAAVQLVMAVGYVLIFLE
jgi:Na+/H+ antiporter NhaD/arsenite permease-like protein